MSHHHIGSPPPQSTHSGLQGTFVSRRLAGRAPAPAHPASAPPSPRSRPHGHDRLGQANTARDRGLSRPGGLRGRLSERKARQGDRAEPEPVPAPGSRATPGTPGDRSGTRTPSTPTRGQTAGRTARQRATRIAAPLRAHPDPPQPAPGPRPDCRSGPPDPVAPKEPREPAPTRDPGSGGRLGPRCESEPGDPGRWRGPPPRFRLHGDRHGPHKLWRGPAWRWYKGRPSDEWAPPVGIRRGDPRPGARRSGSRGRPEDRAAPAPQRRPKAPGQGRPPPTGPDLAGTGPNGPQAHAQARGALRSDSSRSLPNLI